MCDVWVFSCSTDNASVFRPIPGHFYYQSSTQYNLTTGMITHMAVLLLVRIVLTVFLCVHMQLKIVLFNFYLELCWYFDGTVLNLKIAFSRMAIFILLIQKNGRSFHLVVSSISFLHSQSFYCISLSLVGLVIPRYTYF